MDANLKTVGQVVLDLYQGEGTIHYREIVDGANLAEEDVEAAVREGSDRGWWEILESAQSILRVKNVDADRLRLELGWS